MQTRARISNQLSVVIPQFYTTITSYPPFPRITHSPVWLRPRSRSHTNLELRARQLRVEFRIPELLINVRQCLQCERGRMSTTCP